jgi:uncharacterized SAM-binding protein YcdF (DUF218 family)
MLTGNPGAAAPPPPGARALLLGQVLWDYLCLHEVVVAGDAILVLGSRDVRSAEWAAELWREGRAPLLIFSGCRGPLTRDWAQTEAEVFAGAAARLGVPQEVMHLEMRSTNTGENVRFSRALAAERGLVLGRLVVVHTPYLERRARATLRRFWPDAEPFLSSPPLTLETYPTAEILLPSVLARLAGEVHRMLEYPARGYQAPEEVPPAVIAAWQELVSLGYDQSCLGPVTRR